MNENVFIHEIVLRIPFVVKILSGKILRLIYPRLVAVKNIEFYLTTVVLKNSYLLYKCLIRQINHERNV
jgi:hypothetical protein